MPRLVFKVGVGGSSDDLPSRSLRKGPSFYITEWCEEQGIADCSYVEQIWVTEFDDGSMIAYFIRRETLSEEEYEALKAGAKGPVGRVRIYQDQYPLTHTFIEHHPVKSIKLLLDQYNQPQEVKIR